MSDLTIATKKELAQIIGRLTQANYIMREALHPFAKLAEYYDLERDEDDVWDNDFRPTVGDLRAAAAALKETGD